MEISLFLVKLFKWMESWWEIEGGGGDGRAGGFCVASAPPSGTYPYKFL